MGLEMIEFITGLALGLMVYGWYQAINNTKDTKNYEYKTAKRKLKDND
jgi:hypothetical protein